MNLRNCYLLAVVLSISLVGCAEEKETDDNDNPPPVEESKKIETPKRYEFNTRFTGEGYSFTADTSTVSYSGQIFRHILIDDLKKYIGTLTTGAETDAASVKAELNTYYSETSAGDGGDTEGRVTIPTIYGDNVEQIRYDAISTKKKLQNKVHSGAIVGWGDNTKTGDEMITSWFDIIAANAGPAPHTSSGSSEKAYVTNTGVNLRQMVQKFLLSAVTYSQAADHYLGDSSLTKVANAGPKGSSPYSKLEHGWDEAFGYFGACRNYGELTDAQVKANSNADIDSSGTRDLKSEYNFGFSVNAAKRDLGSAKIGTAPTDFSKAIIDAFLEGRTLITNEGSIADIKAQRSIILENWEKVIASTLVHYINEVIKDYGKMSDSDYSEMDHAKHWSELKGFGFALQFSPFKKIASEKFQEFHNLLGDAPVVKGDSFGGTEAGVFKQNGQDADKDTYVTGLNTAKAILGEAYGFNAANLKDW